MVATTGDRGAYVAPAVAATVTVATTRRGTVARWAAVACPFCGACHVHRRPRGTDDGLRRAHCGRGVYRVDGDELGRGGPS